MIVSIHADLLYLLIVLSLMPYEELYLRRAQHSQRTSAPISTTL